MLDEKLKTAIAASIHEQSSIKVASELTGIAMGTLRAWERRYGFPTPTRREDSNRREYSDDDIRKLTLVARALAHGYRPSDVVRMPLRQLRALLEASRDPPGSDSPAVADVPALLRLLANDDVNGIEDALRREASALGPKRFVTELAQPLAQAVGKAWADGELAIRQEHLMTECLTTQLRALLAAVEVANDAPTVVLTTLPGEPHTLGLQMVALYVALNAAQPRLLGASTPPEQVLSAVHALRANVVGVALTPAADLASARRGVQRLARELPPSVALWLGGSGVGALGRLPARAEAVLSWSALDGALRRAARANEGSAARLRRTPLIRARR